jgi:UDP-2,3-diacylglucosamine pyrophosphatase LpxH
MKFNNEETRPRLSGKKRKAYENFTTKERRILIIGDIHAPFNLPGYLDFCLDTYEKWNCNQILMIGDIIDNHYASFHGTDPDGLGGGDELEHAINEVLKWYEVFPKADVMIGNHDRMVMRRAFDSQIPKRWIKSYNQVLGTPGWKWLENVIYDEVLYEHGEGGMAYSKAKNNMMSSVCGHTHTNAGCMWYVGKKFRVFAMQVGCGVDAKSYATAYAKNFKKQAIGCGVVLGGHTAINCMMDL